MTDTGALSPGTMAEETSVGTSFWGDEDNAKLEDGTFSDANANSTTRTTHYLKATNFGFSIPSDATINGIFVEIKRKSLTDAGSSIVDSGLYIVKGGTIGTTNEADTTTEWTTTNEYVSYGSSSNLWGETWTAADINNSTFGIVLSTYMDTIGYNGCYVDHMRITVDYTPATHIAQSKSVAYNDGTITIATLTATLTGNTPTFWMTADGSNFEEVTSGVSHTFTNTGDDLKWKVSGSGTTITNIKIKYG